MFWNGRCFEFSDVLCMWSTLSWKLCRLGVAPWSTCWMAMCVLSCMSSLSATRGCFKGYKSFKDRISQRILVIVIVFIIGNVMWTMWQSLSSWLFATNCHFHSKIWLEVQVLSRVHWLWFAYAWSWAIFQMAFSLYRLWFMLSAAQQRLLLSALQKSIQVTEISILYIFLQLFIIYYLNN